MLSICNTHHCKFVKILTNGKKKMFQFDIMGGLMFVMQGDP